MIVRVLTTCHTQYTWDSSICVFYLIEQNSKFYVTYLTGALYVHPLWFYKHQHDNRVRSKLFVACQRWWFQWRFWFVPSVPGYTRTLSLETVHTTFEWSCQMVVVSRIWCELPLDNCTPTIILNNPVLRQSTETTTNFMLLVKRTKMCNRSCLGISVRLRQGTKRALGANQPTIAHDERQ